MNLKCKLTIEWDEGNQDDTIEAYQDDGYEWYEAIDKIMDWLRERRIKEPINWAHNQLEDCTIDLNFDWSE